MKKQLIAGSLLAALAFPAEARQAVDVHSHIVVPEYMEMLKAHGAELEETFPLPQWSAERHLPYLPAPILQANLQRLKETLGADKELAEYAEGFLWKNAEELFYKDEARPPLTVREIEE